MEKELLLKLRGRLAYVKQLPPYMIFQDKQLEDLLKFKPKTLEELSAIKGFPKDGTRVNNWGDSIIAIFKHPQEVTDFNIQMNKDGEEVKVVPVIQKASFF